MCYAGGKHCHLCLLMPCIELKDLNLRDTDESPNIKHLRVRVGGFSIPLAGDSGSAPMFMCMYASIVETSFSYAAIKVGGELINRCCSLPLQPPKL